MFAKVNRISPAESTNYSITSKNIQSRDSIWQENLVKMFDKIETSYVWQFRWNIITNSGNFIAISNGCYAITGYTKEEMMNTGSLMENILVDDCFQKYIKNILEFLHGTKTESIQEYNLKNGKRVSVNILVHEVKKEYIDFIGLTTNLHHKQQLELMLESSKDLIMIDDGGVNSVFPKILFTSDAWREFGFTESPDGTFIDNYVDTYMLNTCMKEKEEQIKKYGDWDKITTTGKMNGIDVESILTKMGDKTLSVTRDITDRLKRHEAEKALAIQKTARKKDAEANSFIRHEVKNGLFSAMGQIDSLKNMYNEAILSDDIYSAEFHQDIINRYSEIGIDLECTLQTVLSEAMAKDIINNEYIAKEDRVNITELISKIKGDRYKWSVLPKEFPDILIDEQLLFYVIRNALSNANKYGKTWSDILIKISIINTILEIEIINEPGEQHEKLTKLKNPNIIFEKGVRLHHNSKLQTKSCISAGDGAWIMQTCAELCGGKCNIKFEENQTVFKYNCNIKIINDKEDIINFVFPDNVFFYVIDDSAIQRTIVRAQVSKFKIQEDQILCYGNGREEIVNLEEKLYNNIKKYQDYYHIILCDENLDYIVDSTVYWESGSKICGNLKEKLSAYNKNYISFIRSANDSKTEIETYLKNADEFLPKSNSALQYLKEKIVNKWFQIFGIVQTGNINYTYNEDYIQDFLSVFLQDVSEFIHIDPKSYEWKIFWSELHKLKGNIMIVNNIDNAENCILLIQNFRENNFNQDFDLMWDNLCEELTKLKISLTFELGKLEHEKHLANIF
tara:strand:- start:2832 stop:5207 length:2376 start_codon:yes stop_codon:yes gene_type:complete